MMYASPTMMLYTLNLYSAVCQLYPNKTGRRIKKENLSPWAPWEISQGMLCCCFFLDKVFNQTHNKLKEHRVLNFLKILGQGSPTPGPWTGGSGPQPVRNWSKGSFICHSRLLSIAGITAWTIPPCPPPHGKIVFHETGPWCQKGWGLLF